MRNRTIACRNTFSSPDQLSDLRRLEGVIDEREPPWPDPAAERSRVGMIYARIAGRFPILAVIRGNSGYP